MLLVLPPIAQDAGLLAEVIRGGLVESVHLGHLVVLDSVGSPIFQIGNPGAVIYPRSALKPLQALASLRCGFDPADESWLALACSSHSGETIHVAGVRALLASVGLTVTDLKNTPALPLAAKAAQQWQAAGKEPESISANCSGKHAAMLGACVASGFDLETYRAPTHPVQREVAAVVAEFTGDHLPPNVAVDGCSVMLLSTTLSGLAKAYARIATAPDGTAAHRVAAAMSHYPQYVGGTDREVTAAMQAIPGLICKDGAEGVYAGALANGISFAFKILDGSSRPRPEILAATLRVALANSAFDDNWIHPAGIPPTAGVVRVAW